MHIGQWLIADETTVKVFSPWFARGGDNAIFTYEKIATIGTPTFTVKVVHKSLDVVGDGSAKAGTFSQIGSTAFYKLQLTDLKELVRFQYELTAGSGGRDMQLYRMLAPTWFNDAQ